MKSDDKSLVPTGDSSKGGLYQVPNKTEAAQKITSLLEQSNELFTVSVTRPKTDIYNPEQLVSSTKEYFDYCREHGIMPSFRRLANWYGYSYSQLYRNINKETETGVFLDKVRDAIKDNLEQAALVNAVNNISAMFILKTQHDYVEATKVIVEPTDTLLGKPKSVEEIVSYIDADIIED